MMGGLLRDVRFGLRRMAKSPGFTLTIAFTLALGIGATTAIFSSVSGILLRPLPYPQSSRLVRLLQSYPEKGLSTWRLSPASFALYRDHNQVFDSIAGYTTAGVTLTGLGSPERLQASKVTAGFFTTLRVPPLLGRTFKTGEDVPVKNTVCVLSYGFWQRHFGFDPKVIGKPLTVDGSALEIVGVMPPDFHFPAPDTEIWLPLALRTEAMHPWFLTGIARLRPGVTPERAAVETTGLLLGAGRQNPQLVSRSDPPPPGAGLKTLVEPLKDALTGKVAKPLLLLQLSAGLILLIACANVANLLLSRSVARKREIALRYSQGATVGRLLQQLLTESVLLSLLGALAGVLLAWWGLQGLGRLPVDGIPRIGEVTMNGTVLLATAAVAVLAGLVFGLLPALHTRRMGLSAGMKEGQKGSGSRLSRRVNGLLVVGQIGLSLALIVGAGLMLKSFQRLLSVDPGFRSERALSMALSLPSKKYESEEQTTLFFSNLLDKVRALPGVTAAGLTSNLPFSGDLNSDGYIVEGFEPPEGGDAPQAQLQTVSPGYLQALGIRLMRGRDFSAGDRSATPALQMSASIGDDRKSSIRRLTLARFSRSTSLRSTRTPCSLTSRVRRDCMSRDARRDTRIRFAPLAAKPLASSSPIPRLAPVISTRSPRTEKRSLFVAE